MKRYGGVTYWRGQCVSVMQRWSIYREWERSVINYKKSHFILGAWEVRVKHQEGWGIDHRLGGMGWNSHII